jgi:hypothetical protein
MEPAGDSDHCYDSRRGRRRPADFENGQPEDYSFRRKQAWLRKQQVSAHAVVRGAVIDVAAATGFVPFPK